MNILQRLYLFMEHIAEFISGAWRIHCRATFLVENISTSVICHILPWIHPLHCALLEDLRSVTIRHTLVISLKKTTYHKIIPVTLQNYYTDPSAVIPIPTAVAGFCVSWKLVLVGKHIGMISPGRNLFPRITVSP